MSGNSDRKLRDYLSAADSWAENQVAARERNLKAAWFVAGTLGVVAVLEAIALIVMMPLKTVVPYTILVDKQTGYIQALKPLDKSTLSPDAALARSLIAQYVIAREEFDIDSFQENYRRVGLWSSGEARDNYIRQMQSTNPASPLTRLPRRTLLSVEVRAISTLGPETVLVRFATVRSDAGRQFNQSRHGNQWSNTSLLSPRCQQLTVCSIR